MQRDGAALARRQSAREALEKRKETEFRNAIRGHLGRDAEPGEEGDLAQVMVDTLFPWARPGGGRGGFLGRWMLCQRCNGRGYIRKSATVWQACPADCCAGRQLR